MVRLKRYIRACGAHRNYKKLLGSCRSHKERLSVLRTELEALGMKGETGCAQELQEGVGTGEEKLMSRFCSRQSFLGEVSGPEGAARRGS